MTLPWMRKFALTVALFTVALILVGVASAVHQPYPLFLMWVPLLAVPYVLTRPETAPGGAGAAAETVEPSPEPVSEEAAATGARTDAEGLERDGGAVPETPETPESPEGPESPETPETPESPEGPDRPPPAP